MKKILLVITNLAILFACSYLPLNAMDIIPKPKSYVANGEIFNLSPDVKILYSGDLKELANYLGETLSPATGWDFNVERVDSMQGKSIVLSIDNSKILEMEGYELIVTNKSVKIIGSSPAGLFNGIQTLVQMLPVEIYNSRRQKNIEWNITGAKIKDAPKYPWRGMMLDVSRYFFDKDYVMRFIDMMSIYKMNVLHLHLVDDAGWRVEIKKYPKLTSVGAWRGEGHERTGGYYTQDDIREIVAYAALRNVDVIPELEIPAHTLSAIAAYPFLSCTGEAQKVQVQHSISGELYCAGKESTFEFIADVFDEVFELFPSKYIHIGGDEAKYERWVACSHCQARKKELGLENEQELQYYLTSRLQQMVKKYGRTIVGWDDIFGGKLDEKAVGMVWHSKERGIEATKAGHDLVMALTDHCYFDVAESKIPGEVKAATWLPPISLDKVYALNPMIDSLENKYRPQVLGGHATLWSDQFIHGNILQEIAPINENRSEKYFDYLTFPRMAALSEACWISNEFKNWEDFQIRMRTHYSRYDHAGYGYRVPQPKVIAKENNGDGFLISLKNVVEGAEIRYTVDGLLPNVYSPIYIDPIKVEKLSQFRAITVVNRRQFSLPLYFPEK